MMFLGCFHAAQTRKHLLRTQNVSTKNQKHIVSATKLERASKQGNICDVRNNRVRNNVFSFAKAFTVNSNSCQKRT